MLEHISNIAQDMEALQSVLKTTEKRIVIALRSIEELAERRSLWKAHSIFGYSSHPNCELSSGKHYRCIFFYILPGGKKKNSPQAVQLLNSVSYSIE